MYPVLIVCAALLNFGLTNFSPKTIGPVYLTQRSKPTAVLLSAPLWDQLLNRLENQEDLIGSLKAELAIAQGQYEPEEIDFDALEAEVAVDALPA